MMLAASPYRAVSSLQTFGIIKNLRHCLAGCIQITLLDLDICSNEGIIQLPRDKDAELAGE